MQAGETFHYKVLSKLYRNDELNFLVNFNLVVSNLKVSQSYLKDVQGFTDLDVTILNLFSTFYKKELNISFLQKKYKQQTAKQQK